MTYRGTTRRRARDAAIGLVVTVLLVGGAWWYLRARTEPEDPSVTPTPPAGTERVTVEHAIDGDSLEVRDAAGASVQLRLLGIDAPEVHGGEGGGPQCYAREAYQRLRQLAPDGGELDVASDRQPLDPYGRRLVWAWTTGGAFVNEVLAAEGFARPLHIPPNDRYNARIDEVVAQAQAARRGLWAACAGR